MAAKDIAQESFLAAVRNLDSFDRSRPFGPWFKRLANRAIDWTRARQLRAPPSARAGRGAILTEPTSTRSWD
jgi:RNA polymerase sigma-70 factor, ECF subfamily